MIIDVTLQGLPKEAAATDVCICGAGPAGITLALALEAAGQSVTLVEAGGLDWEEESHQIYEGARSVGLPYEGVESCRLRYFGGTSNHWSGMCGLFDPHDFSEGDDAELPGWPISLEELLPHVGRAKTILDLDNQSLVDSHSEFWSNDYFRLKGLAFSSPTRFGEKYKEAIAASDNIVAYINLNAVDLKYNQDRSSVNSVVFSDYGGNKFEVKSTIVVLAMGALENARFLLNVHEQSGPTNSGSFVGRCFMEHLEVRLGRFVSTNDRFWSDATLDRSGNVPFVPSAKKLAELGVGNGIVAFSHNTQPRSYGRTRAIKRMVREFACEIGLVRDTTRLFVNIDCPGDGLIGTMIEQLPNPESRVTLSDRLDQFGLKHLDLNWSLSEKDHLTIRTLAKEIAKEVARQDVARVQLQDYILDEQLDIEVSGHCHQMGTTRMSERPEFGVVDRNLRMHDCDNLYIAGSSVFSTGGAINPTLTIVLLSLRLAEHLLGRMET